MNGALFTTMVRALVIEELEQDYVRTAEATGAGRLQILRRHVMRNVTLPLLTMLGLIDRHRARGRRLHRDRL